MRTYIFTQNERAIVRSFLNGDLERTDPRVQVILSRLKAFTNLADDVDLYLRLRETISTNSA
jgi:hypothetical protein